MFHSTKKRFSSIVLLTGMGLSACVAPPARIIEVQVPMQQRHPAYLHALSDLRAARWMIEHRPGDWAQMSDEIEGVHQIDAAVGEIKHAAIEDGKNINDHPSVDEYADHWKRLHAALAFLEKARADLRKEEDNSFAGGLRDRALTHIDGAIRSISRVMRE